MRDLGTAAALVFVIEGMLYALFPEAMRRALAQVAVTPANLLRASGLAAACLGVAAVWLIRR